MTHLKNIIVVPWLECDGGLLPCPVPHSYVEVIRATSQQCAWGVEAEGIDTAMMKLHFVHELQALGHM